jgi:hypothetical protein
MIFITLYHTTRRHVAEDNFHVRKSLREVEAIKTASYIIIVVRDIHPTQCFSMILMGVLVIPK